MPCSLLPLRLGLIGGALNSAVGGTHFHASRLDGHFRVEAGCFSRDPAQNQNSALAYGVAAERAYANWQTLLDAEKNALDAVVVLTPTPNHVDTVIAALDAGYPVICEKALGVSSTECRLIGTAVRRNRGYLAVTYNYSGYPMVRELRRLVTEGHLGQLQQIHVEMPQEGFLRRDAAPQAWRRQDYAVPTVSLDLGVHVHHLVDFVSAGLKPLEVIGEQASYGRIDGIIDNVYCLARYQDDLRVQAWWGKTALGSRNGLRIRVFGTKASAQWYQMEPESLHWADDEGQRMILDRGSGEAKTAGQLRYNRFKAGHPSGFIEAFANLYADIADDLRNYRNGADARSVFVRGAEHAEEGLRFLEAIGRSAGALHWHVLPPVQTARPGTAP